jgi:2-C-methyl-D-erythritol 4-phosphate cytidylyltransferase
MVTKLKVTIKDDEWKLEHKALEYENFEFTQEHPIVQAHIKEVMDHFPGDRDDVKITVKSDLLTV